MTTELCVTVRRARISEEKQFRKVFFSLRRAVYLRSVGRHRRHESQATTLPPFFYIICVVSSHLLYSKCMRACVIFFMYIYICI